MKLSTKGRYGLRALLDLAVHSDGGHVSLYNVAERQKISVNYLEQVFSLLRRAGIVRSVKGPQGGYALAEDPEAIRVGDILRNLEGSLDIVETKAERESNDIEECIRHAVWEKLNESVNSVVDSMTLQDLIDAYGQAGVAPMYYI